MDRPASPSQSVGCSDLETYLRSVILVVKDWPRVTSVRKSLFMATIENGEDSPGASHRTADERPEKANAGDPSYDPGYPACEGPSPPLDSSVDGPGAEHCVDVKPPDEARVAADKENDLGKLKNTMRSCVSVKEGADLRRSLNEGERQPPEEDTKRKDSTASGRQPPSDAPTTGVKGHLVRTLRRSTRARRPPQRYTP
ncbi:hypothetical protein MTO96_020976 [Rhipicephalus appendiculatus]